MRWLACAAVLLAGLWGTGFAAASASHPRTTGLDPATFPEPAILRPAVHFWEDVFGTYSNNQSVLHSSEHPARVIRVLNFSDSTSRADRHRREKHAVARAEHALKRIVAAKANPKHLKGHALHVYKVFGGGNSAKFEALEGTLRTQSGQRDRTRKALIVAQRYRPKMQAIFAKYDLPTALTNLPVVESSFNLAAYSKVGAAGIWQFMPGSARLYMTLNATQDDRRDPWTSTDAAARMLRDNYAALGSWPLAITAYNYGRGGIQNALEATGGSTLADLIKHCDNPRFGFATSNFYAEFLAANAVVHHARHYFGAIPHETPIRFDVVDTHNAYVPYATLQRLSGADKTRFRALNPAFSTAVVSGKMYVPPDTTIRVPAGHQGRFQTLYAKLGPGQRFDHQRKWYVAYRVRRGDALSLIAARHHVSTHQIMRVNHLRSASRIRIGQVLRIPTGGDNGGHLVAAADHPRPARIIHRRVRHGDTLSAIARRYHVSVHTLTQANHLSSAGDIRAGQLLRIPVAGSGAHLIAAVAHRRSQPAHHRVRHGENLSLIAARYHTSVDALVNVNHLSSASHIRAGQMLKIPGHRGPLHHRVKHGENLSIIAARYHTSVDALVRANHLSSASHIRTGQMLTIPGSQQPRTITHRVQHGQTLSGIAARNHSSVAVLRRVNNLRDADNLRVGMLIKIPGAP